MKSKIFYFTGTGNSLHMAKEVTSRLDNAELIPMIKELKKDIPVEGDIIGLVLPVYMFRAPRAVCKFIKKISKANYIFAIATNAGGMGKVFTQINGLLQKKGLKLNSGFSIKLPDNYIPYGPPPEGEKLQELFDNAEDKITYIIESVNNRINCIENETSFYAKNIWPGLFYHLGYILGSILDTSFKAGDKCNGCEICGKVCPVDNITFKDKKPHWNHKCENCFACIQWCPKEQIQYGSKTKNIKRYQNASVKITEIISQK